MRPIAQNLFSEGAEPHLLGGRRLSDGAVVFPVPAGGDANEYETVSLAREGTLWSWTVQRFPPKSPPYAGGGDFAPYLVGYVELPGEVIVEGRIVDLDVEDARIGMRLETTVIPFEMIGGEIVAVFAFRPVKGA